MSDITHDAVDDGFREIHLSGKHLVFLFMATMVVSVVIFLIGVFVGRSVRAQQTADQFTDPTAALAAASTTPTPAPAPAASEAGPQAAEPPSPPAETDELSYKKRLEGDASAERLKPVETAPAPAASRQAARPPAPAPAPPQAAPAASAPAASVGSPQPGTWVIQVHALRDRNTAAGIVRRLAGKGYPAFLVAAGPPTGTYKVQVGRYKDRDEAMRVIDRLKKEEQFNPWITR